MRGLSYEIEEIVKDLPLTDEQKKILLRIGWDTAEKIAELRPSDISFMLECSEVTSAVLIQRARNLVQDGLAEPICSPLGNAVKISAKLLPKEKADSLIKYVKDFYNKLNVKLI